jgi:four helix bundle protein
MRFLDYSGGSIAEALSHCHAALDREYITEEQTRTVKQQADIVWKNVNNFISQQDLSQEAARLN